MKPILFCELILGDLLLNDAGDMYCVVELAESKFSRNHGLTLIDPFRIVGLCNRHYSTGQVLPNEEVVTFDNSMWVWHSRLGCLLT